jgi:hypothetical protein
VINRTFTKILELSRAKGEEYDNGANAFDNFNRVSHELEMTPESVLLVFASKHWRSVLDYGRDLKEGRSRDRTEPIEDRVDDLIVYLCLLKGMVVARRRLAEGASQPPAAS